MTTILMLIGMIVLGIASALLSYYKRNYYVRIFNDILGKEEDDDVTARVGRGFWYGFWFPIYFSLLITGLIALIAFLIVAGIIAAIVFIVVWITEKILPSAAIGSFLMGVFQKIGFSGAPVSQPPVAEPATTPSTPVADTSTTEDTSDKPGEETPK